MTNKWLEKWVPKPILSHMADSSTLEQCSKGAERKKDKLVGVRGKRRICLHRCMNLIFMRLVSIGQTKERKNQPPVVVDWHGLEF